MAVQAVCEQDERVDPTRPSMDEILEAELAGHPLPDAQVRKAQRSGVRLDKAPFTRLIKLLIAEEKREGHEDPKARVALRCGVDVSRIDTYLKGKTIDESTVERVLNHLGTRVMSDLYPVGPLRIDEVRGLIAREDTEDPTAVVAARLGVPSDTLLAYLNAGHGGPPNAEKAIRCATCSPYCHAPGCENHCEQGRPWCKKHTEFFDGVKQALKNERERFRKRIGRQDAQPQCTAPGCDAPRTPPRAFCDTCQAERDALEDSHWEEESQFVEA